MNARRLLAAVLDVRPGERRLAAAMCLHFFLVITSFWILKPLKKSLFIGHYAASGFPLFDYHFSAAQAELLAKSLNMTVAALATLVFALLATRLRGHRLVAVFAAFFIACYLAFGAILARPTDLGVWSFYLMGDLFSSLMVASFFSFLNDSVSPEAAKRLYGPIGFGGVAGGVFGSSAVALWIRSASLGTWLAVAAVLAVGIVLAASTAARALRRGPAADPNPAEQGFAAGRRPGESTLAADRLPLAAAGLVLRSPYLTSIAVIVTVYEIVSTMIDFEFTSAVVAFARDEGQIEETFAAVYAVTNWLSMFVQLFLTSWVMRRLGVQVALLVLPCAIACASILFAVRPCLAAGGALSISDGALAYSIHQSAKEALYVPTRVEEKYQAKAFIDVFVQRFAKTLGVGVSLVASTWLGGTEGFRQLSFALLPAIGIWMIAARQAGRGFLALTGDRVGPTR